MTSEHYTALNFNLSSNKRELLILDAAGDVCHQNIPQILSGFHIDQIYAADCSENSAIQKDHESCAIFALCLLKQCFKKENLFKFLDKYANKIPSKNGLRLLSWAKFPSNFLKNVQSIDGYFTQFPWLKDTTYKKTTLYEYVLDNAEEVKLQNQERKYINNRIIYKLKKITQLALFALKLIPNEIAIKIVTVNLAELFLKIHTLRGDLKR